MEDREEIYRRAQKFFEGYSRLDPQDAEIQEILAVINSIRQHSLETKARERRTPRKIIPFRLTS